MTTNGWLVNCSEIYRQRISCVSSPHQMLSSLLSWILPSSSSSSTSSEDEEDNVNSGKEFYEDHNVVSDENHHYFLNHHEGSPSTPCAGDTNPNALAVCDASPAVTLAFTRAQDSPIPNTHTSINTHVKRQPPNYSGKGRQYQRLWTKLDEVELLKGYLEYIRQNGWTTNSLQNDVAFFHDDIRPKLQVDFNKNQLVEKLRRLKKKHENVLEKIRSGKEVSFKSPQERAIFNISQKIWGKNRDQDALDDDEDEEEELCPCAVTTSFGDIKVKTEEYDDDEMENVAMRPPKRLRLTNDDGMAPNDLNNINNIQGKIRTCFPPLLDDPLGVAGLGLGGGLAVNPTALGSGEQCGSGSAEVGDEDWKKQRIRELELYLKRLGLLQDQIKARLEELRSPGE